MRKTTTTAALVGALLIGGAAGMTAIGSSTVRAESSTALPTAPAASTDPGAGTTSTTPPGSSSTTTDQANGTMSGPGGADGRGGNHGFGRNETVSDLSVVAKAIGITEADLQTALDGGQTIAAVAKAHNVNIQVVIDALVADGENELAAEVTSGRITQAQADAQKAEVIQRATEEANGTMSGPGGAGH
jgi:hypothetical protein